MPDSRRRPNLFIVGAMKAGTTSLHAKLSAHPQIFMCSPKEPCFFADRAQISRNRAVRWYECPGDTRRYLDLFSTAPEQAQILGEASVVYTQLPVYTGIPERMARFNPAARIIYLVRDPVERAISHYLFYVKHGYERREPHEAIRHGATYVSYGCYAMQLRPYWELFGPERIHVLTLERFSAAPAETLRALFQWLGIDPAFEVPDLLQRLMVTGERVSRGVGPQVIHRARHSRFGRVLRRVMPDPLRSLLHGLLMRDVTRAEVTAPDLLRLLREALREPTEAFSELVGRRFDAEWGTLYGS